MWKGKYLMFEDSLIVPIVN